MAMALLHNFAHNSGSNGDGRSGYAQGSDRGTRGGKKRIAIAATAVGQVVVFVMEMLKYTTLSRAGKTRCSRSHGQVPSVTDTRNWTAADERPRAQARVLVVCTDSMATVNHTVTRFRYPVPVPVLVIQYMRECISGCPSQK